MSNDIAECGCEGHADNFGMCRYSAASARAEAAEKSLKIANEYIAGIHVEHDDLRAKLAAAEKALEQAAGLVHDYQLKLLTAQADNATLVEALQGVLTGYDYGQHSTQWEDAQRNARDAILASPHPGQRMLEAVRLAYSHYKSGKPWAYFNNPAMDALRPFAGNTNAS